MSMRCYGFFECPDCDKTWESAHAYCSKVGGKLVPKYTQDCKECLTSVLPYRVERLRCSVCHQQDCTCDYEDRKSRHSDPSKPHMSELCERCQKGLHCGGN